MTLFPSVESNPALNASEEVPMYAVEISTHEGPYISRFFNTIRAARNWAKWCSKKWPTRILRGGQGGDEVK